MPVFGVSRSTAAALALLLKGHGCEALTAHNPNPSRGTGASARASASATASAPAAANPVEARRLEIFRALDLDHDGVVTREEYFTTLTEDATYSALYEEEDENHDGKIEEAEFKGPRLDERNTRISPQAPRPNEASGATAASKSTGAAQLGTIDSMYYSHSLPEEWQLNVFAHIDTNKDVQLSFLETRAYFVKLQSAGTTPDLKAIDPDAEAQRVFEKDDKNHDQMISYDEFSGPKLAHRVEFGSVDWVAKEDLSDVRTAGWGLGEE